MHAADHSLICIPINFSMQVESLQQIIVEVSFCSRLWSQRLSGAEGCEICPTLTQGSNPQPSVSGWTLTHTKLASWLHVEFNFTFSHVLNVTTN